MTEKQGKKERTNENVEPKNPPTKKVQVARPVVGKGPAASDHIDLRRQDAAPGMSQDVVAHVYDVANARPDAAVLHINRFFKDVVGLGGIFHTAIQVYGDEEWSFGYCERGTGVFNCPPRKNPLYTFRQSIVLGKTSYSIFTVNQILQELSREWPGRSYDLLSRNCNHFSDAFCEELGCPKLPAETSKEGNRDSMQSSLNISDRHIVKCPIKCGGYC